MGTPHGPDGADGQPEVVDDGQPEVVDDGQPEVVDDGFADGQPEVVDDESSADTPPSAGQPKSMRRRLLVFGLIAAAVIGVAEYATKLPSQRDVVVRVGAGIDRVELVWHEGDDVVHRTELGPPFDNPTSPVHLTDGAHRLELSVHRGGEVTHEERRIEVADGAAKIFIEVR